METFQFIAEFDGDTTTITIAVNADGRSMADAQDDAQALAEEEAAAHFDCDTDDEDLMVTES